MVSAYQTNMGELERTKLELSKCKSKNIILNVQIHTLKTENRALKISDELSNFTNLDLEQVYGFRRPHDKLSVGFDKDLSLPTFKSQKSHTLKVKQPKYIFIKNAKSIDNNGRLNNHAYQYRNVTKIKSTYRPKGGNKVIRVQMVGLMK
jgi:hypothetical protein